MDPPRGLGRDSGWPFVTARQVPDIVTISYASFGNAAADARLAIRDDVACESGCQDVWAKDKCKIALEREGCYRSDVNLFCIDLFSNVTPGVPLSLQRARAWAKQFFHDGPRHLVDTIQIVAKASRPW